MITRNIGAIEHQCRNSVVLVMVQMLTSASIAMIAWVRNIRIGYRRDIADRHFRIVIEGRSLNGIHGLLSTA